MERMPDDGYGGGGGSDSDHRAEKKSVKPARVADEQVAYRTARGRAAAAYEAARAQARPAAAPGAAVERGPDPGATVSDIAAMLGGDAVFEEAPTDALAAHDMLVEGLPGSALGLVVEGIGPLLRPGVFEKAIGMSLRTFQRRRERPDRPLSAEQSARLWKFAQILAEATAVFGSRDEAERWLIRPAMGLDQRRPIDLLATPVGVDLVEEHLGRLRYGVYA